MSPFPSRAIRQAARVMAVSIAAALAGLSGSLQAQTLPSQLDPPAELLAPSKAAPARPLGSIGLSDARIVLDDIAMDRGTPVRGLFLLPDPIPAGPVALDVRVYDSLGRLLVDRALAPAALVAPATQPAHQAARAVPFEVAVPAVIAMRNYIKITARNVDGKAVTAIADFIYRPAPAWQDYIVGLWTRHPVSHFNELKQLYITASQWSGGAPAVPDQWIDENFRYYVESTGNWAFSAYHHAYPDHRPVNFDYRQIKNAFIKDRTNLALLQRDPCLSDHIILARIESQFRGLAQIHHDYAPIFYTIGDESGIADQAAPFDFCFSLACQARFRNWLQERYGTIAALNEEWGSSYANWSDVRGETTDELFARKDDNFSGWCDFKNFMDSVLISGYDVAKKAMRLGDPRGRLGMGGAQGPQAIGGWDYWKLTRVLDVIEAYWIGNNLEVIRSLNPNTITLRTSFPAEKNAAADKLMTWRTFIQGDRALYLWDEHHDFVDNEGNPSATMKIMQPHYKELTGGIGMLRFNSQRTDDPIAIYESQANLRVQWVLEVRPEGEKWINRTSATERTKNRAASRRESWVKLVTDNGYELRFIAPEQVQSDLVPYDPATGKGYKVLVLPNIAAMSRQEADAIRKFVHDGGTVLADEIPGAFDEHGKHLDKPRLADLFSAKAPAGADGPNDAAAHGGRAILLDKDIYNYFALRTTATNDEVPLRDYVGGLLDRAVGDARLTPNVTAEDGHRVSGVETTLWRNGRAELVAICRNPSHNVNELGLAGKTASEKFEQPVDLVLHSRDARAWYDVRSNRPLGTGKELKLTLQPFEPMIVSGLPVAADDFTTVVDTQGEKIELTPAAGCPLDKAVYHLDFIGPDNREHLEYRRNVAVPPTGASVELPLALNDDAGSWKLQVREVVTGKEIATPFTWQSRK